MSYNRLGTLAAGVLGLGWLVAVGVNLFVWFPKIQQLPSGFWDDSDLFFAFVRENAISWRVFHVGAGLGLVAAVFLVSHLAELGAGDKCARGFTTLGIVGAVFGLVASLIDQLGTPVIARFAAGNPLFVSQIWTYMEPIRDSGLKTVSCAWQPSSCLNRAAWGSLPGLWALPCSCWGWLRRLCRRRWLTRWGRRVWADWRYCSFPCGPCGWRGGFGSRSWRNQLGVIEALDKLMKGLQTAVRLVLSQASWP